MWGNPRRSRSLLRGDQRRRRIRTTFTSGELDALDSRAQHSYACVVEMHNAYCGVTKREKRVGTMCGRLDAGETGGNRRVAGAAAGLGASEQALSLSLGQPASGLPS